MNSLRGRLSLILLLATGAIWFCAAVWIYAESKTEVERVLDTRLQEAARMVASIAAHASPSDLDRQMSAGPEALSATYQRQLSCQIWSFDGKLLAKSTEAPRERLSETSEGFSERMVGKEPWRVFTVEDRDKGVRVMVGDSLTLRRRLVTDLLTGLLLPTVLIVPLLAFAIWAAIGKGLRPIGALTTELGERGADDMKPLELGRIPREIRPLVEELNKLFGAVDTARRHERELTAFAAHELRTPLAGLKTQAQIAIATTDERVRGEALQQLVVSIDRTSRLIQQMLTTARLDADAETGRTDRVDLRRLVDDIVSTHPSGQRAVEVDFAQCHPTIETKRDMLALALRNLYENAIQHAPEGGSVVWTCRRDDRGLVLVLEDSGAGIPEDELPLVTNRFYRGRRKSGVGSGLGLSITELALKRIGGSLVLRNRTDRSGLRAEVRLPVSRRPSLPQDEPVLRVID